MIKYPENYNPIREYWEEIKSGRIVACKKLKKTIKKLVYDLDHQSEYFYSPKRANHILEFAEKVKDGRINLEEIQKLIDTTKYYKDAL